SGRADLVGRIAGEELIDRRSVIEKPDGRIAHRANHGEFIIDLGQLGQDFGELNARELGVDSFEYATYVVRDIVLGIPEIEVARSALEVEKDDVLRLAETGRRFSRCSGFIGLRLL